MMTSVDNSRNTSPNRKPFEDSDSNNNSIDSFIKNNYQSKEWDDSDYISDESLKQFLKMVPPPQQHKREVIKKESAINTDIAF